MKICLVNTLYPPVGGGGTEQVIATTIELLEAAGHSVILLTTQPDRPTQGRWTVVTQGTLKIYRFRPANIYYYTSGSRQPVWKKMLWHAVDMVNPVDRQTIKKILSLEHPDIVHGHNLKGMSYTVPAVCRALGIPYIQTLHNYQLLHPFGTFVVPEQPPFFQPIWVAKLYQWWNRRAFSSVRTIISPSAVTLQQHQRAGFFTGTEAVILPSPVHLPSPISKSQQPAKKPLQLVYLGAIETHKGISDLIAAIQKLPVDQITLDIYGEGAVQPELEQAAKQSQNIRWRGQAAALDILAQYDALVYPSRSFETQGLAIAEAFAHGTPVIATNSGAISETVVDGKNGLLFPPGDILALVALLKKCLEQPDMLRAMRLLARQTAEKLSIEVYQQKILKLYESARQPS